jgi:hypothetical protein
MIYLVGEPDSRLIPKGDNFAGPRREELKTAAAEPPHGGFAVQYS